MGLRAFVAMPSGCRYGIDFDAVYAECIRPALEEAGIDVFRADEEWRDADSRAEMFQALLCADLVVVERTHENPECWYDLDSLRSLRAGSVLRLAAADAGDAHQDPHDPHYHLRDGRPDPLTLAADRSALAALARAAGESPGRPPCRPGLPWPARRVFLFSGHMIDAPDRESPRFPPGSERLAADAIAARLEAMDMSGADLAICGGACGGDLLFAEAALRRGCPLHLFLQYAETEFLLASVAFAGQSWIDRFYAVKANSLTRLHVQPDELGMPPQGINPYVRNNLWQLYTALAHGAEKVRVIALWNGEGGAAPGGTHHMVETVGKHAGQVSLIDTRLLFGLP